MLFQVRFIQCQENVRGSAKFAATMLGCCEWLPRPFYVVTRGDFMNGCLGIAWWFARHYLTV